MNIAKLLVFSFLMLQGFLALVLYALGGQESTSAQASALMAEGSSTDSFYIGCIVAVFVAVFALRILRTKWIHRSNSEGVPFPQWIILLALSELPGILGFIYAMVQRQSAALDPTQTLLTAMPFFIVSAVSFLMLLPHAHKVVVPKGPAT